MERPRAAEPPEKRGRGRQAGLDDDARRRDGDPPPFAGDRPGVGDVAVEAGSEDQQEQADLVALAADVDAGQGMAQLVDDLGQGQGHDEPDDVPRGDEGLKVGQLFLQQAELEAGQADGADYQCQAGGEEPGREIERHLG